MCSINYQIEQAYISIIMNSKNKIVILILWYTISTLSSYAQTKDTITLETFFQNEKNIIEKHRILCKEKYNDYIATTTEKVLNDLLAYKLPNKTSEGITKYYQNICASNLKIEDIKQPITKQINELIKEIITERKKYILYVTRNHIYANKYHAASIKFIIKRKTVDCPIDLFMKIINHPIPIDWSSLGFNLSSLSKPGTGQLLLNQKELISAQQIAKNEDSKFIGPIINQIALSTSTNIKNSLYYTTDQVFDDVEKIIIKYEPNFSKYIHEAN